MTIGARLDAVRERVASACETAGRDPSEITLVGVSKTRSREDVLAAYEAGQRHFGENRVQEAISKLGGELPQDLVLHMVGHLQRNKAAAAARLFHVFHGLDDVRTIARLDRVAGRALDVLLQVKLAREETKSGAAEEDVPALMAAALEARNLRLRGLMLVPPRGVDPMPYFRRLGELRVTLGGARKLPELSMGMSGDFEQAIVCGATMIRVGTAIFGARG